MLSQCLMYVRASRCRRRSDNHRKEAGRRRRASRRRGTGDSHQGANGREGSGHQDAARQAFVERHGSRVERVCEGGGEDVEAEGSREMRMGADDKKESRGGELGQLKRLVRLAFAPRKLQLRQG